MSVKMKLYLRMLYKFFIGLETVLIFTCNFLYEKYTRLNIK